LKRGRQLFSERGCLACHSNQATAKAGNGLPEIASEAHFGPNLSRIAAKLGSGDTPEQRQESARRWVIQWVLNPNIYHPRTFMPITHLTIDQASDLAAWLLAQKTDWPDQQAKELNTKDLQAPSTETLKRLATVYLERNYSTSQVKRSLETGFSA